MINVFADAVNNIPTTVVGLLALIVSVEAGVIIKLYVDGKNQAKEDAGKITLLQDLRLTDYKDNFAKVMPVMEAISQTMPLVNEKLKQSKRP